MGDRGRIVVVAAGFGHWRDGRCLAAGKWTDVSRVRAYKCAAPTPPSICVGVQLRDGSEMEVQEDVPGFASFVNAAATKLPGMPVPDTWIAELRAAKGEVVLFERRELGGGHPKRV
jgi:hypothetical protein